MPSSAQETGTRLVERPGEGAFLVLRRATLSVTDGPDRGRSLPIGKPLVRVGKAVDNDLVLADPAVSAHHFELVQEEGGCVLRDLRSTNGTFVDGQRVREVFLRAGAEIAVGETRVRFSIGGGEVQLPLSQRLRFGDLLGHGPAMRAAFAGLELT
jgi:pSer/pThr/pTyr-binding forkhead associated (FHA) protein